MTAPVIRATLAIASFLVFALSGCTAPAEVGEECVDSSDCIDGTSCFEHQDATPARVCMSDCELAMERICGDGAVCTRATGPDRPETLGVCYLGGTTAAGATCENNLECVRGTICVIAGASQACFPACTVGDDDGCATGESCEALEDMGTNGFCRAD